MIARIRLIALDNLSLHPSNVRTVRDKDADAFLLSSIKASGVLQPPIVEDAGNGRFLVVAGGRRLAAVQQLAKQGDWKSNDLRCAVLKEGADPGEIAIAENEMRQDMHLADQLEAFRFLDMEGRTPEEIGTRFGYSTRYIRQRLRLARVDPSVLQALREDRITLEAVQAFTLTDDHKTQRHVLKMCQQERTEWDQMVRGHHVRRKLSGSTVNNSSKFVKFVGMDAYKEAGGTFVTDLFSQNRDDPKQDVRYLEDTELLERLVLEKLAKSLERRRLKNRWKWAEARPTFSIHDSDNDLVSLASLRDIAEPTEEEAAELAKLDEEYKEAGTWADQQKVLRKREKVNARVAKRDEWPSDVRAISGVILSVGPDGKYELHRGLARPEDVPDSVSEDTQGSQGGLDTPKKRKAPHGLSKPAMKGLRELRTDIERASLAQAHFVAFKLLTYQLGLRVFGHTVYRRKALAITKDTDALGGNVQGETKHRPLREKLEALPLEWLEEANPWDAFLALEDEQVWDLFTMGTAMLIVPQLANDAPRDRAPELEWLAGNLGIDWGTVVEPEAIGEVLLAKLKKSELLKVARKHLGKKWATDHAKLKKGELVKAVQDAIAESDKPFLLPGFQPK